MPNDCVSYKDSGYFSPLINDYLEHKPDLGQFYNRFPIPENFDAQIQEKSDNYTGDRQILVDVLRDQYRNIAISDATKDNIDKLSDTNTYTVTTGHQLNIFTGPLYFLYKIVSTINLSKRLKAEYPDRHFVPVYWMATEDHDLEEINYFNFKGKIFRWNHRPEGAVGRMGTEKLHELYAMFSHEIGESDHATKLKSMFRNAYLSGMNLANATRILADSIFGSDGLVILDADTHELKKQFIPHMKADLTKNLAFSEISRSIEALSGYDIQVNPREINLFYLGDDFRERIIFSEGMFRINNTDLEFSEELLISELQTYPERFSPNVVMRPLYQEVILPNLCYIGGGGEIAYWLELKSYFDKSGVTFPMLLLRNSVLLATHKQSEKADKLGLSWKDLFLKPGELVNSKISQYSQFPLDFSDQKSFLKEQFEKLRNLAKKTDQSFASAVSAQETKQLKGLAMLEKRLLKAEKKIHADKLARLVSLHDELFPNASLQERFSNFSEFYLEYGEDFLKVLHDLDPFSHEFTIFRL